MLTAFAAAIVLVTLGVVWFMADFIGHFKALPWDEEQAGADRCPDYPCDFYCERRGRCDYE